MSGGLAHVWWTFISRGPLAAGVGLIALFRPYLLLRVSKILILDGGLALSGSGLNVAISALAISATDVLALRFKMTNERLKSELIDTR